MKTTTTTIVTEDKNSDEITHFENKEIFRNGFHVALTILNSTQCTFSLLNFQNGTMSHVDLTYEEMIAVLNRHKYKRFRGEVEFKQD